MTIKAQWPTTRAAPRKASYRRVAEEAESKPAATPAATEPAPKATSPITAQGYQIAHDPMPPKRVMSSKYSELMANWPKGAAVRCTVEQAKTLASALRKHIRRTQQKGRPHICTNYPGADAQTPARVWWVAE